jgi:hypothetical protein
MTVAAISGSFTRPDDTTAYASGDLVANSTTAGDVVAVELRGFAFAQGGSSIIRRVKLAKSGTGITNASFRVHLMRADPTTVTNGDNAAFSISGTSNYLGSVDVTVGQAMTDGACGFVAADIPVRLGTATQTLWAMVEARGAYTPVAQEVFTVSVEEIKEA